MKSLTRGLMLIAVSALLSFAVAQQFIPEEMDLSPLQLTFDTQYPVGEILEENPDLDALSFEYGAHAGSLLFAEERENAVILSFLSLAEEDRPDIAQAGYCRVATYLPEVMVSDYIVYIVHMMPLFEEGRLEFSSQQFSFDRQTSCARFESPRAGL